MPGPLPGTNAWEKANRFPKRKLNSKKGGPRIRADPPEQLSAVMPADDAPCRA